MPDRSGTRQRLRQGLSGKSTDRDQSLKRAVDRARIFVAEEGNEATDRSPDTFRSPIDLILLHHRTAILSVRHILLLEVVQPGS